ncbi:acetyl-coenzyme A synthetase 2-like, mitochondrial [Tubulanus polymorphus]|uniref:acetyl-coenzyme A synthetase 2-like, mitochondrial n=1 Tax=Tubulanus polymorphus TaxID=672921 RepID=UPI003DA50CFB
MAALGRRLSKFSNFVPQKPTCSASNALKLFANARSGRECHSKTFSARISTVLPEFAQIQTHDELHKLSLADPDKFWGKLGRNRLDWFEEFDIVKDCNLREGKISWFLNGKLNAAVNCIDRHFEINPSKVALIWEKDEPNSAEYITYKELKELTNQISNMLISHGTMKGDRVIIYMPTTPMVVAAMLACTRIGAIHSVVFAGFSAEALAARINGADAKTVITSDQAVRGGKSIELKRMVDAAVKKCPCVKTVFVSQRTGNDVPMGKIDIYLEKEMSKYSGECESAIMDSEDTLFMLYTSGSTGSPKGIAHTHAGYLLYAGITHQTVFDYQPDDVFGCVADIGWITGHSYVVYGPLVNGATTLLFESIPTYPNPGRYWEMVERLKLNQIYLAPTALRLLLKYDESWVRKYDRSSLRTLGCVGEPLNHEAWEWYHKVVGDGRCPIVDTWWQTETGGILISPRPSEAGAEIRPSMPMRPFYGVEPAVVDPETGKELKGDGVYGALTVKHPWPGMARTIYGDHGRFKDTYFTTYPGYYFTGDGAHRHEGGYYQITGRMDDVINVSGHRLGTAEIEDALDEHPAVAETAVVGYPHSIKGEGVYAYITLKENVSIAEKDLKHELKTLVREKIAPYAAPEMMQITAGLPKTRSGKIMRRILRKIAANQSDDLGDISTLADPSVVDIIIENHRNMQQ